MTDAVSVRLVTKRTPASMPGTTLRYQFAWGSLFNMAVMKRRRAPRGKEEEVKKVCWQMASETAKRTKPQYL